MIKAIIFDLDGVIIESAEIKTKAFELLFDDYPDKLTEMIDYHKKNAGISRYVKIRYFYEKILGQELSLQKEEKLGQEFSRIVLDQVLNAPYTPGAIEFFCRNKDIYSLFVASGTPYKELRNIISHRKLNQYFKEIHGSPEKKHEIIDDILNRYGFTRGEAVFVGDAESDRLAAEKAGIFFIARINSDNHELRDCQWQVQDLTELEAVLSNLSSGYRKGG